MGEDVADLNGVNVAYLAMCNHYSQMGLSEQQMRKVQQQFGGDCPKYGIRELPHRSESSLIYSILAYKRVGAVKKGG